MLSGMWFLVLYFDLKREKCFKEEALKLFDRRKMVEDKKL